MDDRVFQRFLRNFYQHVTIFVLRQSLCERLVAALSNKPAANQLISRVLQLVERGLLRSLFPRDRVVEGQPASRVLRTALEHDVTFSASLLEPSRRTQNYFLLGPDDEVGHYGGEC